MLGMHARRSVRAVDVCLRSRAGHLRAFRTNVPAASSLEIPAGTISGGGGAPDLANPRTAFQASSSYELARGVAVLTACNQPWLVRNAEAVLSLSRRWLGGPLTDWLLRHTVFAHFVAGETLTGDNAYSCEICGRKVDALKRTRIARLADLP